MSGPLRNEVGRDRWDRREHLRQPHPIRRARRSRATPGVATVFILKRSSRGARPPSWRNQDFPLHAPNPICHLIGDKLGLSIGRRVLGAKESPTVLAILNLLNEQIAILGMALNEDRYVRTRRHHAPAVGSCLGQGRAHQLLRQSLPAQRRWHKGVRAHHPPSLDQIIEMRQVLPGSYREAPIRFVVSDRITAFAHSTLSVAGVTSVHTASPSRV